MIDFIHNAAREFDVSGASDIVEGDSLMKRQTAVFLFLGVCILLAALLIAGEISPLVSGAVFAVALVLFGGLSRGFRR